MIYTIRKKEAARTRIWGCEGHYMGLKLNFVLRTGRMGGEFSTGNETGTILGIFLERSAYRKGKRRLIGAYFPSGFRPSNPRCLRRGINGGAVVSHPHAGNNPD